MSGPWQLALNKPAELISTLVHGLSPVESRYANARGLAVELPCAASARQLAAGRLISACSPVLGLTSWSTSPAIVGSDGPSGPEPMIPGSVELTTSFRRSGWPGRSRNC